MIFIKVSNLPNAKINAILFKIMGLNIQPNTNGFSMKDLLAKVGFDLPKVGEILTGEIISISKNTVIIDLGSFGTGIVYPGEFYDNTEAQKSLKPGQQVSAVLMDIENEDGYRELSLKRAQKTTSWEDIRAKRDQGEIIETQVTNLNKGGLIVEINGIPGFLPLSQLTPEHYPKVDGGDTTKIVQALQKMRGMNIKIKILDFNEAENRLIVSEKAVYEEQLRERLAAFKIGDIVDAEVTEVTDFGAFVAIGQPSTINGQNSATEIADGEKAQENDSQSQTTNQKPPTRIDGLIHISEIDWGLVENPRDFLKLGDVVKAKIIDISDSRVSLSLKALKPNPWEGIENKYSVGQTLEGEVIKMTANGVVVKLEENTTGLIPSSEFTDPQIMGNLNPGDKISVAIISIEPTQHKITLTLQK